MKKKILGIFILTLVLSFSILCNVPHIQAIVVDSETPEIPTISGPSNAELYHCYNYNITTSDPQNDDVFFIVVCSDNTLIYQSDWYKSGETLIFNHCWDDLYGSSNHSIIRAKAIDSKGYESDWGTFDVQMKNIKDITIWFSFIKQIFRILLERLRLIL